MSTVPIARQRSRLRGWVGANSSGNAGAVIERGFRVIRNQNWLIIVSGFFEPVFYLLATSAMNGAIYDSTWNVFFKLRFAKLYQGMLATSLGPLDVAAGEIFMALFRGFLYALGFTAVIALLGLATSWWALAMIPVALLIALGFAAVGMALTSYFSTFQQMDWINIALLPMFMFSATLFPIDVFPQAVQWFVMALPLWHGVELMRQLSVGHFEGSTALHLGYFVVMSVLGIAFTTRRLRSLFLR
jgi:lipooligosaccharide transport system permease protein